MILCREWGRVHTTAVTITVMRGLDIALCMSSIVYKPTDHPRHISLRYASLRCSRFHLSAEVCRVNSVNIPIEHRG